MMNSPESKVLGKNISYPENYDPEILVAVPRIDNRKTIGLDNNQNIFTGYDIWHAYEASFLLVSGMPYSGILKIVYPSSSEFIVESKSLKLYLNSLNNFQLVGVPEKAILNYTDIISRDLSKLLQTDVNVSFHNIDENTDQPYDFTHYESLESMFILDEIKIKHYQETPDILKESKNGRNLFKVYSNLLRSNCKVTFQPDWGSVFIHYEGESDVNMEGLLKYLVSFRNENHFHEEICETIYTRLWNIYKPDKLAVSCLYTRRGGIDICPARASHESLLPEYLSNSYIFSRSLMRQ